MMKKHLASIGFALVSALAIGGCTATAYPGYAYSPRPVYYQSSGYYPGGYYPNGYYSGGYYAAPVVTGPTVIARPGWGHGYGYGRHWGRRW